MRRRVKDTDEGFIPARLRVYNVRDWPNPKCHPECAFWEAVEAWREAQPDDPEGDGEMVLIDGPDTPWHEGLI